MAQIVPVGQPVNESETEAIRFLRANLPDGDFIVVHNFELRRGQTEEIDLAIIAPNGVYIVDCKGYTGNLTIRGGTWTFPGSVREVRSPAAKVRAQAKEIASMLKKMLARVNIKAPRVEGLVVLTDEHITLTIERTGNDIDEDVVHRLKDLPRLILDGSLIRQSQRLPLPEAARRKVAEFLAARQVPGDKPRSFGNWIVTRTWPANENVQEFLAKREGADDSAPEVMLRVHQIDRLATARDQAQRRAIVGNAYYALNRLPPHQGIISAKDFLETMDGEAVVVLEHMYGIGLAKWLSESPCGDIVGLHGLAFDLLEALQHMHEHGLVHRALTPNVIARGENGRWRIRDFDFAKTIGPARKHTVAEVLQASGDARYRAPESDSPETGKATDVWAFGTIAYQWLTGETPFTSVEHAVDSGGRAALLNLTHLETSRRLDEWFTRLFALNPTSRPSAAEALEQLDNIIAEISGEAETTASGSVSRLQQAQDNLDTQRRAETSDVARSFDIHAVDFNPAESTNMAENENPPEHSVDNISTVAVAQNDVDARTVPPETEYVIPEVPMEAANDATTDRPIAPMEGAVDTRSVGASEALTIEGAAPRRGVLAKETADAPTGDDLPAVPTAPQGEAPAASPKLPVRLNDRYRLLERLSEFSMGWSTWRAVDELTEQALIVKTAPTSSPGVMARLLLQQAVLSELPQHASLQRFLDADIDGEFAFVAYHFVVGKPLSEHQGKRRTLDDNIRLITQLADGLTTLHEHGFAHGDVKPANIVAHGSTAVIIDLDLVGRLGGSDSCVSGTPAYIPPDDASADDTHRQQTDRDCFALGVTAYELLSGRHPWNDMAPSFSPPPPLSGVPGVNQRLAGVIHKAILGQRRDRYATVADFKGMLQVAFRSAAETPDEVQEEARALQLKSLPWNATHILAVSAIPEWIARRWDKRERFASGRVMALANRSQVSVRTVRTLERSGDSPAVKAAAAVLQKLAVRGAPAPCSPRLEHALLDQAARTGVLSFHRDESGGEVLFSVSPTLQGFDELLEAASFVPLLMRDQEVSFAIANPLGPESASPLWWAPFVSALDDKRLALMVSPSHRLSAIQSVPPSDLADIVIDATVATPSGSRSGIALQFLAPDVAAADGKWRKAEKALTAAGWDVVVADPARPEDIELALAKLRDACAECIPETSRKAGERLRALPSGQRAAIAAMYDLPAAEARLLCLVADHLSRTGRADLKIIDVDDIGLETVVDCVAETVAAVTTLFRIGDAGRPSLARIGEPTALSYFGRPHWPSPDDESRGFVHIIAPQLTPLEQLRSAQPQRIRIDSEQRRESVHGALTHILQLVFRKARFREGQLPIIERAIALQPVVGLLPTSAGKSICYQLAAMVQPGSVLVIEPLRALILDQAENLRAAGLHRVGAIMREGGDANLQYRNAMSALAGGTQIFSLLAPERLQMRDFRTALAKRDSGLPVCFCVIDESHCVSEWGHDFRPAYLNVGRLVQSHVSQGGYVPALLALTGTASRPVLVDILRELGIMDREAIVEPRSFDRKELHFSVVQVPSARRSAAVCDELRRLLEHFDWDDRDPTTVPPGVVFSNFANSSGGVGQLTKAIRESIRVVTAMYSTTVPNEAFAAADVPDKKTWENGLAAVQRSFKRNKTPLLVCTPAFGMGIDKPDIRFTLHSGLPRSLEEFYQQAGRAGRDGKSARCVIVFADDQPSLADELLDTERTSLDTIKSRADSVKPWLQGDAIRNTWFLTNSFIGREREKNLLRLVARDLAKGLRSAKGDITRVQWTFDALKPALVEMSLKQEDSETLLEKALYRLTLVGGLDDYEKNYSKRLFIATLKSNDTSRIYGRVNEYLTRYSTPGRAHAPIERRTDFAHAAFECGCAVIDYVYDTVEMRRRRALGQMLQTARDGATNGSESFRQQLLAYLEDSPFTERVARMSERIDPEDWSSTLEMVTGGEEAMLLLGACRRALEVTPRHPGLLLLAGIARLTAEGIDDPLIDVRNGLLILREELPDPAERVAAITPLVASVTRLFPQQLDRVLMLVLEVDADVPMIASVYRSAPENGRAHGRAVGRMLGGLLSILDNSSSTRSQE